MAESVRIQSPRHVLCDRICAASLLFSNISRDFVLCGLALRAAERLAKPKGIGEGTSERSFPRRYGGSVNAKNCAELSAMPDVDGSA